MSFGQGSVVRFGSFSNSAFAVYHRSSVSAIMASAFASLIFDGVRQSDSVRRFRFSTFRSMI